ncbi:uncharacterized protein LOC114541286 [Dendronephthya gigantea]|uniref:uncharacterized protein LOC114541286 n=1 Tax=Dendronephthya gigantea TaxID=151771 RepID=UPI00106C405E|nr:uncharacterized protein LOC114541286 [Dendronephthya gigantea]
MLCRARCLLTVSLVSLLFAFILISLSSRDPAYSTSSTLLYDDIPINLNVQRKILQRREETTIKKTPCRSLPDYLKHKKIVLDPKIIDGVDTMLMFIGYPRSGHTLIGSLIDAHPNMVIANEYNILGNWENYTTEHRNRQYLFEQLYTNSYNEAHEGDRSSKDCLPKTKYNYLIPNQWQGKFNGKIKIIGDKKGGKTTVLLQRSEKYWSFLQEIQETVHIPIKFIHTIRNPFDNIATMLLRREFGNNLNWTEMYKKPLKLSKNMLIQYIRYRMNLATTNARFLQSFPERVYTLRSEDVVTNPELELLKICHFLNIECSEKYIKDCTSIVRRSVSRSRNAIVWDMEIKDIMFDYMKKIPFYKDYKFHE